MRDAALIGSLLPVSALLALSATAVQAASLDRQVAFSIPSQPLDGALLEFSRQADIQLALDANELDNIQAPELKGTLAASVALRRLLSSSGFKYYTVGNTVTVRRTAGADDSSGSSVSAAPGDSASVAGHYTTSAASNAKIRVASASSDVGASETGQRKNMDEVIVSAQKRSELLQDVPVPVTAISAQNLIENNQLRLQDYYVSVPGLSVVPVAASVQNLSIRGITTGSGSNPTVGITVDDVPYGSSTAIGNSGFVPDFDPGDLARVEVLRGPQGTLYGASSMGGLVKFVTVDPSTERVGGTLQAGVSGVYNGDQPGYNVRGSVNLPLGDQVAVRASVFSRIDPGYIDNVETGRDGVNKATVRGGRVSGLWAPSSDFSVKLSALLQDYRGDGNNDVATGLGLGDLQQNYIRGTGGYDRRFQAYAATIKAKLGGIDLISVTGYNSNSTRETSDVTWALADATTFYTGVPGTIVLVEGHTHKVSEEVRLSSSIGSTFDWLLGGFYTHEASPGTQPYYAEDPATGQVGIKLADYTTNTALTEYSAFANLTFHITEQFDIQLGAREAHIKQDASQLTDGLLYQDITSVAGGSSKSNAFTYLVTPQYKFTKDLMIYARLASGYRAGAPNTVPNQLAQYNPDKTQNYELGFKGDFLEHLFSVDASVYYIDWKDIQVVLQDLNTFQSYTINANRAKSQGVELSTTVKPLRGLAINSWVSYDDAKLTEAFPPTPISTVYGVAGDRLPYTSRWSGSISAQQDFPLPSNGTGFVGATVTYVGDREGTFTATPERQIFPAYTRTDLRGGAQWGTWSGNLFVLNLADRRAMTSGGPGTYPDYAFNYIQPRTYGLNVIKSF